MTTATIHPLTLETLEKYKNEKPELCDSNEHFDTVRSTVEPRLNHLRILKRSLFDVLEVLTPLQDIKEHQKAMAGMNDDILSCHVEDFKFIAVRLHLPADHFIYGAFNWREYDLKMSEVSLTVNYSKITGGKHFILDQADLAAWKEALEVMAVRFEELKGLGMNPEFRYLERVECLKGCPDAYYVPYAYFKLSNYVGQEEYLQGNWYTRMAGGKWPKGMHRVGCRLADLSTD